MTATKLPQHHGEDVSRAIIKITGAGTGMSEGLAIAPIALEVDDEEYFIVRATCAETGHIRDKNGLLVRTHRLHTEDMAPIDSDTAQAALAGYADMLSRRKAEIAGQLELEADEDLEGKEAMATIDETGSLAPQFKGE